MLNRAVPSSGTKQFVNVDAYIHATCESWPRVQAHALARPTWLSAHGSRATRVRCHMHSHCYGPLRSVGEDKHRRRAGRQRENIGGVHAQSREKHLAI